MLSASHVESQRHVERQKLKKKNKETVRNEGMREILFLYIHVIIHILHSYHTLPLYVIGPVRKVALPVHNLLACNEKR
jgi:hypothetical protein